MQRYFVLIVLICFSLPLGLSIAGCGHNTNNYCLKNGHAYGPTTNQVTQVILGPQTTGISLAWGQTASVSSPTAYNCENQSMTVSNYSYGSNNSMLADISPTGEVCAGTWNRYSQGLLTPYTVCTPPSGAAAENCGSGSQTNSACGMAEVTATGAGVASNPVDVYVHPPITSILINNKSNLETQCFSEGVTPTDSSGNFETLRSQTTVYGPNNMIIPLDYVGAISYSAENPDIVTINNTTNTTTSSSSSTSPNGTVTARYPGATLITASAASSSSAAAGYFYTCAPTSIKLAVNGQDKVTITNSSSPTVTATILDKNNVKMTGITLDYTSTQPQNLTVSSSGAITNNFPSTAIINAICQPGTCNPAPIDQIGLYGAGLPVVSNNITISAPGRSSQKLWMASTESRYISTVDLTVGTTGTTVQLPYAPNSMVSDAEGDTLYLGNARELMVFSTSSNGVIKQDTSVPGVVLAASADGSQLVIADQLRKVIYLYSTSTGSNISIAGVATHAEFSPDGKTVYITGPDDLYVHNTSTGWSTYPLQSTQSTSCTPDLNNASYNPTCGRDLAIMVPQEGPFITGSTTTAYGFCPDTTVSPAVYYPEAASVADATEHLAALPDGDNIIGATDTGIEDIWVYSDAGHTTLGPPTGACPQPTATTSAGFKLYPLVTTTNFTGITPTEITHVLASPDSSVAFVTYQSAKDTGILPAYQPSSTSGQPGTLTNVQLSSGAGTPIVGAFAPGGNLFFASTTGDDLVHEVSTSTLKETGITINPRLTCSLQPTNSTTVPCTSGQAVPAQFIVVKSRSTT